MTLPKGAELLGASSGEVEIKGLGADTVVTLSTNAHRRLTYLIGGHSTAELRGSVYLGLENIRGTFDAVVLNTYMNLPENARPADHRNLLAESVGLYGLRRASIRYGENTGEGLTFILEITRILVDLLAAKSFEKIRVTMIPDAPLPDAVTITVGRISIFSVLAGTSS